MAEATTGTSGRFRPFIGSLLPDAIDTAAAARAYALNVANGACTKLAEQLASPGLVLAWLLAAIGAPGGLVALLVPLRQAGALLPQIAVSGRIRGLAYRKWAWVAAGTAQGLLLLAMLPAVVLLPPAMAGWALLLLLLLFSVASGCGSVAFQDVTAKTIPSGGRGRMLAARAAIGGALTLAAGAAMRATLGDAAGSAPLLLLVGGAAILWLIAAGLFAAIPEPSGEPGEARNALAEWRRGVAALRRFPGFRRFLTARALLLAVEVAMPVYALHVHGLVGGGAGALGYFVLVVGLAGVLASPFWGRLADGSARRTMIYAAGFGALAGGLALVLPVFMSGGRLAWAYGVVFLVLGIALSGVRLGRKTYLIDGAPDDERPLLVAFSNTVVGLLALLAGALGLLIQAGGVTAAIVGLAALSGLAAVAAARAPEAPRMTDPG